jgi:hypothetical protein
MTLAKGYEREVRTAIFATWGQHKAEGSLRGRIFGDRNVDLEKAWQPGAVAADGVAPGQLGVRESVVLQSSSLALSGDPCW